MLDLKLWKAHPYDYHINSVETCLKEIPNAAYRKPAILNLELVDYLAVHHEDRMNQTRLLVILKTAIEGKKYDFISVYYQKGQQKDYVFEQLFAQHKNLWERFDKNDDEKQSLKQSWYRYAETEQRCDGSRKWLSEHYSFVTDHIDDFGVEHWESLISDGGYDFTEMNDRSAEVLDAVANANAYQLTRHNLKTLVGSMLNIEVESVSYSLVAQTENEALIERVEENLGECMKTVFAEPEAKKEGEDAILGILLSPEETEDEKIAYLKGQQTKIELEQAEKKDVKKLAVKCDVVEPSWENVVHYLNNVSEKAVDEVLIAFVDKHAAVLSGRDLDNIEKEDEQMLLQQFIGTDNLPYDAYKLVIEQFRHWYYGGGVPKIEEQRILLLNDKGMLHYSDKNTESIQNGYSVKTFVTYLLKNRNEYMKAPEAVAYNTEVALELMRSNLTSREKAKIVPNFKADILNTELANEIVKVQVEQEITLEMTLVLKVLALANRTDDKVVVISYTL